MKYVHLVKIIHLDLKPENILVFWDFNLGRFIFKVTDVGGSIRISQSIGKNKMLAYLQ